MDARDDVDEKKVEQRARQEQDKSDERKLEQEPQQERGQRQVLAQEQPSVTVEDLRSRDPGADPVDPYTDVDHETLPEWWVTAIAEFEERDLRTYQPSRLTDGAVVETVSADLAERFGVSIRFAGKNVQYGDQWQVVVDGTPVSTVTHRRSPAGFSVFGLETSELERLVQQYVAQNA